MRFRKQIATIVILVVLASSNTPMREAASQEEKGKVCRTEQQCHWENFKKVCVYVKVCR
jgi:hypothetical protein